MLSKKQVYNKSFRKFVLATACITLSACAGQTLDNLRKAEFKGSEFQNHLAKRYQMFAEKEADQYDWVDAGHFADKGLSLAYGNMVEPEDPNMRDVPDSKLLELEVAREELVMIVQQFHQSKPSLTADAQYYYDCWVEEQEEAWQSEEIMNCRDRFYQSLDLLRNGGGRLEDKRMKTSEEIFDSSAQDSNFDVSSAALMVFFDTGASQINHKAKKVIDALVHDLTNNMASWDIIEIVLNGHTDTLGDAALNMELSYKRAENVKKYLVNSGVPKNSIKIFAFGEEELRVPTKDGVSRAENRRVEIILEQ